jgi:hypothetical protein
VLRTTKRVGPSAGQEAAANYYSVVSGKPALCTLKSRAADMVLGG